MSVTHGQNTRIGSGEGWLTKIGCSLQVHAEENGMQRPRGSLLLKIRVKKSYFKKY